MRNLIALSLALTTLSSTAALACGDLSQDAAPPHVLRVDTIQGPGLDATRRSFVVLDTPGRSRDDGAQRRWTRLPTDTFTSPTIADATTLATPVTLTLVGPHGARVIETRKQLVYRDGRSTDVHLALEIPASDEPAIAIAGRLPDVASAAWHGLYPVSNDGAADWLSRHQIEIRPGTTPAVRNVMGTYLEVIWYTTVAGDAAALVRRGSTLLATGAEHAVGVLDVADAQYLVSNQGARMIAVPLAR